MCSSDLRVTGVGVLSGVGPYDVPGLTRNMRWQNRVGFRWGARWPVLARVLYAVQGRVSQALFHDRATAAAWRSRPAWYAVSRQDRTHLT